MKNNNKPKNHITFQINGSLMKWNAHITPSGKIN